MRKHPVVITAVLALALSFTVARAQEFGTKDEAKAMVDTAVSHVKKVGPEQAFKDFTSDKAAWQKKDLYIVAIDMDGVCKAHGTTPQFVGKNLMELKDANGVHFVVEMTKVAKTKGDGWVDYLYMHPQTKKISPKSLYVKKLSGYDAWVGVGIYK